MQLLQEMLETGKIEGCNFGVNRNGDIQVSIRRKGASGWQTYYGLNAEETMHRALRDGPQRSDDWTAVTGMQLEIWDCLPA